MCQLCDEANAYLAEIEAEAKAREEAQKLVRVAADMPSPKVDPLEAENQLSRREALR